MTEDRIIALYWERHENAIKETKNKYGRLVLSVLRNICRDDCDVEECENDTYLAVWNSIPDARPQSLSAFICAIARNIGLKRVEYWSADKRNPNMLTAFDEIQEIITGKDSMEQQVEHIALEEALNIFLAKLREQDRLFFLRRYWYFDSIKDIAKRFSVSEGCVKSSLRRTRNRLGKYLTEQGFTL